MNMRHKYVRRTTYQTVPFPKLRRALALIYPAVQRTHKTHGLVEVDVTEARRYLHVQEAEQAQSFTAFIIACLAQAVGENPSLNACRKGGKHLALFDDLGVATPIERDLEGRKQPIVYIICGANRKGVQQITREIRAAQVMAVEAKWEGFQAGRWLMRLPMVVLKGLWAVFWWARTRYPRVQRRYGGTVGITAVGSCDQPRMLSVET